MKIKTLKFRECVLWARREEINENEKIFKGKKNLACCFPFALFLYNIYRELMWKISHPRNPKCNIEKIYVKLNCCWMVKRDESTERKIPLLLKLLTITLSLELSLCVIFTLFFALIS
jgi:hypothetical protein